MNNVLKDSGEKLVAAVVPEKAHPFVLRRPVKDECKEETPERRNATLGRLPLEQERWAMEQELDENETPSGVDESASSGEQGQNLAMGPEVMDIVGGVSHCVGVSAVVDYSSCSSGVVGLSSLPCELSAEAVSFNPSMSMLSAGAIATCKGGTRDGKSEGSEQEQMQIIGVAEAGPFSAQQIRRMDREDNELASTFNYCKQDLDVWKQDMVRDAPLRTGRWEKEARVKRWQQSLEEELQTDTSVYPEESRKVYKVGWRPVWAVDPPGDTAFPPLLSMTGPLQSQKHGTALSGMR